MKAFWMLLLLAIAAVAQEIPARERALQEKLIAACCWSESLANHRSEVAARMKVELHALVAAGRSDEDILAAFQRKYGKRVLMEPQGSTAVLVNMVPAVAGLLGLAGVAWLVRRWARPRTA